MGDAYGTAPETAQDPIGAGPSVPARLGFDVGDTLRFRTPQGQPFGMQPLSLTEQQVYGDTSASELEGTSFPGVTTGWGESSVQYVPPLPAAQTTCIVNGFDPSWGTPPETYRGVVMRFNWKMGAYQFNPESMEQIFLSRGDPKLDEWFGEVASRYRSGYMLQPYRTENGSWTTRWIPMRQNVVCPS